ncbi:Pleiotropic drug resistance ABC transporter protein [Mycena sanguinolenta]|uniref:Pleiotropic drug resistance ABC transporter protein n=1 Tax=Mycena sanguinolenta TaxID=230812 RepID=A0A8H7DIH0_9AGAR|nr:Pleiotropic drug resistance ABC transporter protein [Mycena sanguinolenta]
MGNNPSRSAGGAGGRGGGAQVTVNYNPPSNAGPPAGSQFFALGTPDTSSQLSAPPNTLLAAHPENKTYCDELQRQGRGFPLFFPEPQLNPPEWRKKGGVAIGDVGQVTPDGSFDFLFNIYLGENDPINAYGVPEGFKPLVREEEFEVKAVDFEGGNFVGSHTVTLTAVDGEQEFPGGRFNFSCRQSTGAVLALPHGAHQEQLLNLRRMELYAAEHAESWYKYANITRGRGLVNGRLYLITGWEKAKSWGIAYFRDVSLQSEFKLSFGPTTDPADGYKYRWSGSQYRYKQANSPLDDGTPLHHTTFIHSLAISLGERAWEKLFGKRPRIYQPLNWPTFQKSSGRRLVPYGSHGSSSPWSIFTRIFSVRRAQNNGGRSSVPPRAPFPHSAGGSASSGGRQATASAPGDGIVTDTLPILPITHPSQIIHQRILRETPQARVVITHDDAWRDVFKEDGTRTSGQTPSELEQAIFDRFDILEEDVHHTIMDDLLDKPNLLPQRSPQEASTAEPEEKQDQNYRHEHSLRVALEPFAFAADNGFEDGSDADSEPEGPCPGAAVEDSDLEESTPNDFPTYFTERDGRLYHSYGDSPYPLPVDTPEQERMKVQHQTLFELMGDYYPESCPVPEVLAHNPDRQRFALDLCTGSGLWTMDMAQKFPHITFHALDIVPIATRYPHPNVEFSLHDVNTPTTWAAGHFDFIHARSVSMARTPTSYTKSSASSARAGSFSQVNGAATQPFTQTTRNEVLSRTPALVAFFAHLHAALVLRGLHPVAPPVAPLLAHTGTFDEITAKEYYMPIGSWHPDKAMQRLGRAFRAAYQRYMASVRPMLIESGVVPADELDDLYERVERELAEVEGLVSVFHTVYARKI